MKNDKTISDSLNLNRNIFFFFFFFIFLIPFSTATVLKLNTANDSADIYLDSIGTRGSVMKWDIRSVPSGATIHNATLCLYINASQGGADSDVEVSRVNNQTWKEGDSISGWSRLNTATYSLSSLTASTWTCFEITIPFNASYDAGDDNFTLYFDDPDDIGDAFGGTPTDNDQIYMGDVGGTLLTFEDRENTGTSGNTPYLNVTYTSTASDTTPPNISITSPANDTNFIVSEVEINYTISSDSIDCWWTQNAGASNTSLTCGNNITTTFSDGLTTIVVYANDSADNINNSYVAFTVDTQFPIFYNYGDNNATIKNELALFNVLINSTNGTTGLEINSINYTAINTTSNIFNVSINFTSTGVHSYYWWSYGNGTNNNYNISISKDFTILAPPTTCTSISDTSLVKKLDEGNYPYIRLCYRLEFI